MYPGWTWPLTKPPGPVDVAVTSVSPWSVAKRSPVLLEVQWKVSTRGGAGWRMEEGSPGPLNLVEVHPMMDVYVSRPRTRQHRTWHTACVGSGSWRRTWSDSRVNNLELRRNILDSLPTLSGRPCATAEGPGGSTGCTYGRPVTGDWPASHPDHCQANIGGI